MDNQIVSSVIHEIDNTIREISVDGDRYLIDDKEGFHISEYVAGDFITTNIDTTRHMYIYVIDTNKTIIVINNKIWSTNEWFICNECNVLTNVNFKLTYKNNEYCNHCFFAINYTNPKRDEYDGHPMTIGKYIQMYSKNHNIKKCKHPNRCFICDYKKGKVLCDINDRQLIYSGKLVDQLKNSKIDIII